MNNLLPPAGPHQLPDHLPEPVAIPTQLVQAWLGIPAETTISPHLTRGDFDRFYSAINRTIQAQGLFQQAMIEYTNNRPDIANNGLKASQRLLIEAQNNLHQLMSAIMASAIAGRNS